ncbi:ferredoxin [Candidatus Woesearchaeota archaeon]|nr:ferredoxin [Candidatus Woesearchaeota archaeon]
MAKIIHEKWKCISCGACVAACAEFWEMGDDGKAHLKGAAYKKTDDGDLGELAVDDIKCNKEAEAGCPVQCIHVKGAVAEEKPSEEKAEEKPSEEKAEKKPSEEKAEKKPSEAPATE